MTQNVMTAFKRGSYMYMYSKLLLAHTVYTVFKRLLILFVTCGLIIFSAYHFSSFLVALANLICQQNSCLDGIQKTWVARTSNSRSVTVSN